jgi:hypothetical protein
LAAVGGCDDVFGRAETQPTVELYDSQAGYWFLLGQHLQHARTTAGVVAVDGRRLLIVGGAPALSSAEFFRISPPGEALTHSGHDTGCQPEQGATPEEIADMVEGRMGCQAALLSLPPVGATYPVSISRCVAIIGGERCSDASSEWARPKQFSNVPVYDLASGSWRQDSVIPPMSTERTAVALCVASGHLVP